MAVEVEIEARRSRKPGTREVRTEARVFRPLPA
jgi:hypothetical protein